MIIVSDYDFLRNDYHGKPIKVGPVVYPTAEHAFQAMKTDVFDDRVQISNLNVYDARKFARSIPLDTYEWDTRKFFAMKEVLTCKFEQDEELAKQLVQLNGQIVMASEKDMFWGKNIYTNEGENNMGVILSEIRDSLQMKIQDKLEDEILEELESDEEPDAIENISTALNSFSGQNDLDEDISEIFSIADQILDWHKSMPGALDFHPELIKLIEKLGEKVADAKKEINDTVQV